MARKLGHANFSLEPTPASDDFLQRLEQSDMFDMLRETGLWWQAPPHFFDSREFEALLEPERAKRAAPER